MWDWSMQSWRDFKKILNRLHRVLLNRYSAENSGDIPDCTGLGDDRERGECVGLTTLMAGREVLVLGVELCNIGVTGYKF